MEWLTVVAAIAAGWAVGLAVWAVFGMRPVWRKSRIPELGLQHGEYRPFDSDESLSDRVRRVALEVPIPYRHTEPTLYRDEPPPG